MKRLLLTNLLEYAARVWLVTVTAPGVDVLPWACVDAGCDGARRRRPAGYSKREAGCVVCGCSEVQRSALDEWNRTAPRRFAQLHRRAHQATARRLGVPANTLASVWQLQARGVLHRHLALGFETELEQVAARVYVAELRARAREFGFGLIDARDRAGRKNKRSTVMEAGTAAGYLSRYLGDSAQLIEATSMRYRPERLVWVSRKLTAATGCTMTRLRRVRLLFVIRERRSSLFALGGRLPRWFSSPIEYAAVAALCSGP